MTRIQITDCPDRLMWYRDMVGQAVECEKIDPHGYWAREPGGYLNVIRFGDAQVLPEEVPDGR